MTILIPVSDAPTVDEAIDIIGERLKPYYWAGRLEMDVDVAERLREADAIE